MAGEKNRPRGLGLEEMQAYLEDHSGPLMQGIMIGLLTELLLGKLGSIPICSALVMMRYATIQVAGIDNPEYQRAMLGDTKAMAYGCLAKISIGGFFRQSIAADRAESTERIAADYAQRNFFGP